MKQITKEQLEDLYIKQNLSKKEVCEILNIGRGSFNRLSKEYQIDKSSDLTREHIKNTNLKRYGYDNPAKNKEIKEKTYQTNLERYGCHPTQTQEVKEKFKQLYSTGIPQDKCNNTKKNNHTFNYSRDEQEIYQLLLSKFPSKDVIRQYKSQLYPFSSDFYIKSLDLYIEYNGSHYHGPRGVHEPFNKNDPKHLKKLQELENICVNKTTQVYHIIRVWTQSDPLKRETAIKNSLNFIELWNLEQAREFISTL